MPGRRGTPAKLPEEQPWINRWWPPVRDIGAFLLGTFILIHQEVWRASAQPWLVAAGLACLGITGSGAIQRYLLSKLDK